MRWRRSSSIRVPLRRAAGERAGPIAKQWEGEVVLAKDGMFLVQASQPTSPSPRKRGAPPSPPAMTRAERALCSTRARLARILRPFWASLDGREARHLDSGRVPPPRALWELLTGEDRLRTRLVNG